MIISLVLEKFIKQEITNGNTDSTIRHYKTHINLFINYFGDNDINKLSYSIYQEYILYLRSKYKESSGFIGKKENLSSRTIKTYASALKTFLSFSYNSGYLKEDIASQIKMPKYKNKVIEILNMEQIRILLNSFDINTFVGCRDLLVVSLLLDCGLRLSELIKIKLEDISLSLNVIKIDGKGQKERLVPLTPYIQKVFKIYKYQYFLTFSRVIEKNEQIIKNINGENATKNTISLIFRRIRKKLGIKVHPHLLRHTFATLFLINGGDISNLQIILGHSTLNMVLNYLHLANQINMCKQVKFTPLSNIKKLV